MVGTSDSNESFAINIAVTLVNAIINYIFYRIVVSIILIIKETLIWILGKTETIFETAQEKRVSLVGKSRQRDESPDEYIIT
ncbi:hypothetical protein TKK_0019209 [Trichogramma kaykai]